MKCKTKSFFKKLWKNFNSYIQFPHIWVAIVITILLTVSLGVSIKLQFSGKEYEASIFSNIFAGLITGLILCLIGGSKQIYVSFLKSKKVFCEEIKESIIKYKESYNKLLRKKFQSFDGSEELYNLIYDIHVYANDVNSYILQSKFDDLIPFNTRKFCKKKFAYDSEQLIEQFDKLHENVEHIDIDCPTHKEILGYFSIVDDELDKLNMGVRTAIKQYEIKIETISRVII